MAEHILIIDDDDDFRNYLIKLLTKQGYFVDAAKCGPDALNGILEMNPDIVITDIIMPEMDGFEVIKQIKDKFPDVKIIAMSGGGRIKPELYLEMALKLKADSIIRKPFKKDELLEKIKKIIKA